MVHGGGVCVRRLAGGVRNREVGFHRFLANSRVTVEKLIAGWSERTVTAVAGREILAIQDTSEINFRTPGGRDRGLGLIGKGVGRGLLLHPMIAVDAHTGECLGLVGGHLWTRVDRKGETKKNNARRPLSEKESRHWIETAQSAKATLAAAASVTMIADREADIFQLWAQIPAPNVHVLGRLFHDRPVIGGGSTTTIAQSWPVRDLRKILLREREDREEREAELQLRFGEIAIARPVSATEPGLPDQISLTLIELTETNAPAGAEPIVWRLLTSRVIDEVGEAWRAVDHYRQRWIIEQLFRTLKKQGLQIEDSQIESAERLLKLVALATLAAVTTLQLVQARDGVSALPALLVFSQSEVAALEALNKTRYAGNTPLQKNPHPAFSLPWAAWIVARMGGWDGYPSSRPPGPITFKTGLNVLKTLAEGWALRDVCMP